VVEEEDGLDGDGGQSKHQFESAEKTLYDYDSMFMQLYYLNENKNENKLLFSMSCQACNK